MRLVIRFLKDEKAATAIEYGLIAAGISIAIISVVKGTRDKAQLDVFFDFNAVEISCFHAKPAVLASRWAFS